MPEFPEVENFSKYFNKNSLNKKIEQINCKTPSLLKYASCTKLNKSLKNHEFNKSFVRGKFLIAPIKSSDYKLVFHFGMGGDFEYLKANQVNQTNSKYAHLIILFTNGYALLWNNPRKFGKVYFVQDINQVPTIKKMGPDAMEISQKDFMDLLESKSTKNIKAFLMDQSDIAGIGNIYSNEILFQANINPHDQVKSLTEAQKKKLYNTIKTILKKAISLDETYPKSWILAHKKDLVCPKNRKHKLKLQTIAGRTAIYCPIDQR